MPKAQIELSYQPDPSKSKPMMQIAFALKGEVEVIKNTYTLINTKLFYLFPDARIAWSKVTSVLKCFLPFSDIDGFFDKLKRFVSDFSDSVQLSQADVQALLHRLVLINKVSRSQVKKIEDQMASVLLLSDESSLAQLKSRLVAVRKRTGCLPAQNAHLAPCVGLTGGNRLARMALRLALVHAQTGNAKMLSRLLQAKEQCDREPDAGIAKYFERAFIQKMLQSVDQVSIECLSEWSDIKWLFQIIASCHHIRRVVIHDCSGVDADTRQAFECFLRGALFIEQVVYKPLNCSGMLALEECMTLSGIAAKHQALSFEGISEVSIDSLANLPQMRQLMAVVEGDSRIHCLKIRVWSNASDDVLDFMAEFLARSTYIQRVVLPMFGAKPLEKLADVSWLLRSMRVNQSIQEICLSGCGYSDQTNQFIEALMKQVRVNRHSAFKSLCYIGEVCTPEASSQWQTQNSLWRTRLKDEAPSTHMGPDCDESKLLVI